MFERCIFVHSVHLRQVALYNLRPLPNVEVAQYVVAMAAPAREPSEAAQYMVFLNVSPCFIDHPGFVSTALTHLWYRLRRHGLNRRQVLSKIVRAGTCIDGTWSRALSFVGRVNVLA